MIGEQKTGRIDGAVISNVTHEPLRVEVNGRPARLAIVTEDGKIYAIGDDVAREARAVSINIYRAFVQSEGYLRVWSKPIPYGET
jgi:hypothetical protein